MKYNFDKLPNRRGTNSVKYDECPINALPMSLADMDFPVAEEITQAIKNRLDIPAYGYSLIPNSFFESISNFYERRHNIKLPTEEMVFVTGVVPAISSIVRRITHPNENVVVLTPIYNIFFNSIINNGAKPLDCNLKKTQLGYDIDFDDLELKLSNPQTSLMIFCNPHNPTGNIWTKEEIKKVASLCKKYNVICISDEVHCELLDPGYKYTPFYSVSDEAKEISISCISTSKTYNCAGLHGAIVLIHNPFLRHTIERGFNNEEIAEPDLIVIQGMEAAFNKCDYWLDEVRQYIQKNKEYTYHFLRNNIPQINFFESKATYLLWLDVSKITNDSEKLSQFIIEKTGLILSKGIIYHGDGTTHLRINLATSLDNVKDGLNRLKLAIEQYK